MDVRKRPTSISQSSASSTILTSRGDNGFKHAVNGSDKTDSSANVSKKRFSYIYFILTGIIMSLSATLYCNKSLDKFIGALWSSPVYAIIIDSGSTGSRLLAFTFQRGPFSQQWHLVDELWDEVKPGLSAFADDPKSAAASISKLINTAKQHFPESQWHLSPITLKATAGLRLLPANEAEAIISEVEQVLIHSGFKLEKTLVEIMNPRDEGLFGWFTVNFLSDFLSKNLFESFVTLDLGGGSTQITFAPKVVPVAGLEGRKHFLHNVTLLNEKREVYTHSYLGLGLMAAREAIFTQGKTSGHSEYQSACMASSTTQSWAFHGNNYVISADPMTSYESCREVARRVVAAQDVHAPTEIHSRNIAAFSYFFDRAVDVGIVALGQFEAIVPVSAFVEAAKSACKAVDSVGKPAFFCADLSYMVSLLVDGYGLSESKNLHLVKKINGHETSWALGVAYSILTQ